MFTGIVQNLATVDELVPVGPGVRLVINDAAMAKYSSLGDSIAINGCCLTVVDVVGPLLAFDAGPETLERTNLGELVRRSKVNLEPSMSLGDSLGGHLVTGHIDGVGTVEQRVDDQEWSTLWFRAPQALMRQMASKGSVAIDGVSLTLVEVKEEQFSVALIPHTLRVTTLGQRQTGDRVNLETDVLAKYVERQLEWVKR